MTGNGKAPKLELVRETTRVYAQALELLAPHWENTPDVPRYIAKRVVIRLLELSNKRPDVLLGVAMMRSHRSEVAEHSLRVGVVIANLVTYLSLPRRLALDAVLCGLLHHIGQDTHGAYHDSKGAMAQRSLMALLLSSATDTSHYRQVLAAFQHGLGYDGTGEPRLNFPVRQHPLTPLLTLANDLVERATDHGAMSEALGSMNKHVGTRYHPGLFKLLARVVGPVQVGSVVRFSDGRTGFVVAYRPTDAAWSATAVDVEEPSQKIDFGSEQGPTIDGLIDTREVLTTLANRRATPRAR